MLEAFFTPQSVAVIGAARKPGKLGYGVLSNLLDYGYSGRIYPINPKAMERYRDRYRMSSSKSDPKDAMVLCHGAPKTGHLWAAQKRPVVGS